MSRRLMPRLLAGSYRHEIMSAVAASDGKSMKDLHALAKSRNPTFSYPVFVSSMENMVDCGVFELVNDRLTMTVDGHNELNILNAKLANPSETVKANLYRAPAGAYRGDELKRTCYRPGAYDAYDKPSLINRIKEQNNV